ncbi:High-affinity glucose transporter [Madurella mycetomatis]|uniref:High-affinity glucose transporter n=1 Tax=Madurella mycetomatis TaxID=100816 RepID=A0A175VX54_9PEZI|nr:High-affinity glucose transporter [Madurella mycetomatis]KXX75749.1 High-affinity glucose transporter [Madurella mycetomatis]
MGLPWGSPASLGGRRGLFPISFKIPGPNQTRLPSNIPLRTLPVHDEQDIRHDRQQSSWLLPSSHGHGHAADEPAYSGSDDGSDESSWADTGDIAEQLDEEDPLRERLNDAFDDEALAGVLKRQPKQHKKRVRYQEPLSRNSPSPSQHAGSIDKEAIRIPDVARRKVSKGERLIAAIMTGGTSSIHGLTGKPLLYFTSVFVSLGVFLFGYDQGVMSGIITGKYFVDYFHQPTHFEIATMVAILEIGALISSLVVGRIGDIIGRRKTIFYGSCIFVVGGGLQSFALNIPMMMVGRILAGLGVGMLSTIVPVYQSEISPPHNRGKLACIEFSGNIIGYATSVWVDYFCGFIESNMSWRIPLFMQCVMGTLLGLGSLIIVESPRWLLDNDHDEEGIVVIANLYGGGDIHHPRARDEFRDIKMNVLLARQEGERTYKDMFKRYGTRVFIAMSAQALAQLNGINVISYYAPLVFEAAGWEGHDAVLMTGINGITYFLSTIPPWYIVDRWGRRPILLSGAIAMAVSLSMISYYMYLDIPSTPTMVVIMVMIYNAAFGYSWGPIPWLYPPEILPLKIRSKGASLSTATNWACNWLVGEMTPILQVAIEWRLYLIHAFFCVVSFVVVYFIYPETCGVRLEDMDALFGDATGAAGTPASSSTPAMHAESDALVRPGSPVPPLDIRSPRSSATTSRFGATGAIPGLNIDPPNVAGGDDDRKARTSARSSDPVHQGAGGGFGGWISRIMGRGRAGGSSSSGAQYAPLDQRDD